MELSEIKRNIDEYQNNLNQIRGLFDLENKETNIQEYEEMMADPGFWDDQNKAQDIIDKNNALKSIVNGYHDLANEVEDMSATRELLQEEYDEDMKAELEEEVIQFKRKWINMSCNYYLMDRMMRIMRFLNFTLVLAVQNLKIGRACY